MSSEQSAQQKDHIALGVGTDQNQYLTYFMDDGEYGVDILRVQEIRSWDSVTPIPNTPDYIKGVINLRGVIVPIVDLRIRFGMDGIIYGSTTVIIVLKVINGDSERVMGIVVDAVSDVYSVSDSEINPSPEFGEKINTEFIKGLATVNEKMMIIIDIDRMLDTQDLVEIDKVTEGS